jgi:hypothetical protein
MCTIVLNDNEKKLTDCSIAIPHLDGAGGISSANVTTKKIVIVPHCTRLLLDLIRMIVHSIGCA